MKRPLQIGVTGGIGSGKSLVCKIFSSLGVPIYDADSRAKSIMTTDGILVEQIKKEFGDLAYDESGELNREHIGRLVFQNEEKRKKLNELVHPRVAVDTQNWIKTQGEVPYVVKEAALLFESGGYKILDKLILVTAPEELRIKRVMLRDPQRSRADIKKIIRAQMPEEEKMKLADVIIHNDETELILRQVLSLHQQFFKLN